MNARRDNLADEWPPLRTLTDIALRRWHVRFTCPQCKHVRVMSGAGLRYLFYRRHWRDDIKSVRKRFYCAHCRLTRRAKIMPQLDKTTDAPCGQPLEDPTDYEWKSSSPAIGARKRPSLSG